MQTDARARRAAVASVSGIQVSIPSANASDWAPGDTARVTQVWNGLDFPDANATYEE